MHQRGAVGSIDEFPWKDQEGRICFNPFIPGLFATFMGHIKGTWPKPAIVQHATFAILHLCVAIAKCSSYHVMIPFMDSIKMPHDIRYTLM